jgi:UPF0755 protein
MAIQSAQRKKKPLKNRFQRLILFVLTIAIIVSLIIAYNLFQRIMGPNVKTPDGKAVSVIIPTGSTFGQVKEMLYGKGLIINHWSFEWMAERKNYSNQVKPGHYLLEESMSNNQLINMLRAGLQTPVRVVFNNARKKEDLAAKVALQIEADSLSLMKCWHDKAFLKTINTTPDEVFTLFIPNTYEMWWTTDAYEFTERMYKENKAFWNEERLKKAGTTGLSTREIMILASIVEKETLKNDEKKSIAGVYINRLRKGWPLQADPTVVFALGDFEIKRVLKVHTQIDSPYNTYLRKGLPPGPICMPSIASIDAVLNFEKHNYMFFCARPDLSGYHAFARTLSEHNRNAKAYQRAISNRK